MIGIDVSSQQMLAADPELRRHVQDLQNRLQDSAHQDDALSSLWETLKADMDRITTEHAGMADELISVYEQLGIVFDVTRRLAGVDREETILDVLLDSLKKSFLQYDVRPVPAADPAACAAAPELVRGVVEMCRQSKSVITTEVTDQRPYCQAMGGGVFASSEYVGAVVMLRTEEAPEFRASDMLLLESLVQFCGDLIANHRLVTELRTMSLTMVRSLVSAVDQKDPYTSGHSLRVAYYSTMLAQELDFSGIELQMLQWSALLHDVGKIGIDDNVLKKEGKLSHAEFAHMKEHPVRSHRVVSGIPHLRAALDGVLYHHEKYDGSGYPEGLRGEDIPLQARIIQIADIFDALTSNRSYRSAFTWDRALAILEEESGTTVDPALRRRFDQLIRSRLEKDENEWARMVDEGNQFLEGHESTATTKGMP